MKEIINSTVVQAVREVAGSTNLDVNKFYIKSTFDYKNSLSIEANGEITSGDNTYTYEVIVRVNKKVEKK